MRSTVAKSKQICFADLFRSRPASTDFCLPTWGKLENASITSHHRTNGEVR